jgi:thiamine-phosphate pyrophosphorylase
VICYVTDRRALGHDPGRLAGIIRGAIAAGVDWVQVREKDLPTRELLALVRQAMEAAQGRATKILVNDRLDVALAAGAAGVHLGGESMPVGAVVEWLRARGERLLVGRSCHSPGDALQAENDGADYVFFGPVFATPAKLQYGPPQGVERLAEVCRAVRIPVIAIGGITLENAAECWRAGAAGIAAIRLFQDATDIAEVVRRLRAAESPSA